MLSRHRTHLATGVAIALLAATTTPHPARAQTPTPVQLQWTAPGDDGNVGRASYYDVRYQAAPIAGIDTTAWWDAATQALGEPPPNPSGSTETMQIPGLTIGATYYFIVRAADEVLNWSGFSNVAVATVQACDAPTNAPSPAPAEIDTAAVDVLLSWSGTPTPSDPATTVRVYRATGSGGSFSLLTTLPAATTSYRDANVNAGTLYRYQFAWGITCGEGPRSSTVSVTPVGPPGTGGGSSEGSSIHVYPNPASGPIQIVVRVAGSAPARATIRLYTLTGQWVADLVDETLDTGEHTRSWARYGRTGQLVSPGYYEAIGTIGSTRVRERLVLLP